MTFLLRGFSIPFKIKLGFKNKTTRLNLFLALATFPKMCATKPKVTFPSRFLYNKSKLLIFNFLQELLVMQQN